LKSEGSKNPLKDALAKVQFSEEQIQNILNNCDKRIKNISAHVKRLWSEALDTPDSECVNVSSEGEVHYLLSQLLRITYVIDYINLALKSLPAGDITRVKLIDIGATQFTFLYKDLFGMDVSAVDKTDLIEKRCHRRGITFKACDITDGDLPFEDNEFDICIFTEVLEHLCIAPKKAFVPIKRILKNGGFLIFSTPNIATLQNRINLLFGRPVLAPVEWVFRDDFETPHPHGLGHVREFTMIELLNLMNKYSFEIIDKMIVSDSNTIKGGVTIREKINYAFQRIFPSFGMHCLILARNKK
jgi:SAM-dependent methyltransferase